jgi:alkylated DNA repair dioxygenase AlkB
MDHSDYLGKSIACLIKSSIPSSIFFTRSLRSLGGGPHPPERALTLHRRELALKCNHTSIRRIIGVSPFRSLMAFTQPSLFPMPVGPALPRGLLYCPDVITPEDERCLLDRIADLPFKGFQFHGFEGKRRVVSFGWSYDFSEHKALPAHPIPDFLLEIHRKVQAASGFALPDLAQVLITEYAPGAPIGWHKDRPFFNEVMGLSLASACIFRLRKPLGEGKWQRVSLRLEPRSAYLLQGVARREWEHSIPPVESLRYSVTFRNLRSRAGSDASLHNRSRPT